jgi:hypothetical protein
MSNPAPSDKQHDGMQEALRRDAARIQEPPFDASLHHATIRRIRALADTRAERSSPWLMRALATGGALLLVIVGVFTRHEHPRAQLDVASAVASSQDAIARLSLKPPMLFPPWESPTASMLEQPRLSTPNPL